MKEAATIVDVNKHVFFGEAMQLGSVQNWMITLCEHEQADQMGSRRRRVATMSDVGDNSLFGGPRYLLTSVWNSRGSDEASDEFEEQPCADVSGIDTPPTPPPCFR